MGNLHLNTTEGMLHDLFAVYGEVASVTIATDGNGIPPGQGYVEMKEPDAIRAIQQLNKINFMNQFLNIYETGHL